MSSRILFVGLGNYTHPNTRHNAGMMILDHLAASLDLVWTIHRPWQSHMAQTVIDLSPGTQCQLTLLKPRLLMNVSGTCVAKAARDLSIPSSDVYVFQDDLQRDLGKVSIKVGGSANGHNGIKSVIKSLRSDQFKRVRIGVGRPESRDPNVVADYVLDRFLPSELDVLEKTLYPLLSTGPGNGLESLLLHGTLPLPKKQKSPKPPRPEAVPPTTQVV